MDWSAHLTASLVYVLSYAASAFFWKNKSSEAVMTRATWIAMFAVLVFVFSNK